MRYASAEAFRTALERRLSTMAEEGGAHALPSALPAPPQWSVALSSMATQAGIHPGPFVEHEQARGFLDPILIGTALDDARCVKRFGVP